MKHLHDSDELIFGSGALSKKIKLLIAEALRVSCHLAGVGTLYTASVGLKGVVSSARRARSDQSRSLRFSVYSSLLISPLA
jgi:hypothetical protein